LDLVGSSRAVILHKPFAFGFSQMKIVFYFIGMTVGHENGESQLHSQQGAFGLGSRRDILIFHDDKRKLVGL
jgi:hypothetical protein